MPTCHVDYSEEKIQVQYVLTHILRIPIEEHLSAPYNKTDALLLAEILSHNHRIILGRNIYLWIACKAERDAFGLNQKTSEKFVFVGHPAVDTCELSGEPLIGTVWCGSGLYMRSSFIVILLYL